MDPSSVKVRIESNGMVSYSEMVNTEVHCTLDVGPFPFDVQNCTIAYTSWVYHDNELSLYPSFNVGNAEYFQENTEWGLLSYDVKRFVFTYDVGSFSEVHYQIVIKRKPMNYIVTIV